ncbi:helix-hairpin-helix domain-containing protein [Saprospiraceae bacterium]|nr:helix-hairpin-helix domain-containing protein [Saprospiraceae bacterium]
MVAQDTIPTIIIEKLEDALENQAEVAEIDINNIADDLSYFSRSPLDLNKISEVQMEEMQILNSIQIQDFLSYRDIFGPFYSTYELQAIKSMDIETIRDFLPYVKVSGNNEQKTFNLSDILSEGTSQVLFKWKRILEDREGFTLETLTIFSLDISLTTDRYLRWVLLGRKIQEKNSLKAVIAMVLISTQDI